MTHVKEKVVLGLKSRPFRSEESAPVVRDVPEIGRPIRKRRPFLRSCRAAGSVAGVAGILAVSLTVAPPSHALAVAPLIPPVIAGATEAVGGGVITAALVSNPIGWTIAAVGGVGIGLYSTKDYWLSYNPGQLFFGDNSNTVTSTSTGAVIDPRVTITGAAIASQPWILDISTQVNLNPQQTQDIYYHVSVRLKCNTAANGSGTALADTVVAPYTYYTATAGAVGAMHPQCASGYVTGAILGATNADPLLTANNSGGGPTNVRRVGNLVSGTQSGNPRGATTTYYTTTDCINDQGVIQSITAQTTGDVGGVKIPSCAAAGKGHSTGAIRIDAFNSLDGTTTRVWETRAPAVDPNEPLCAPTRPGAGCKYSISIDGKPCVVGDLQCENWPDVNNADSTHTRVTCNHGPYVVALAACGILEKAYFPGGTTATDANIDGNPATSNNTDPNGTAIPAPQSVQTGTVPGDAGRPDVKVGPTDAPSVNGGDCFPSGWGVFNPVEWVVQPVGCALRSAFEPKSDTLTQLKNSVKADIDAVGFGPLQASVVGMFAPLGTQAGCTGPPVTFSWQSVSQTFHPFDACSQPMATVAAVSNAVLTVVISIGGGLAFLRAVSQAFGYNFSIGKGAGAS